MAFVPVNGGGGAGSLNALRQSHRSSTENPGARMVQYQTILNAENSIKKWKALAIRHCFAEEYEKALTYLDRALDVDLWSLLLPPPASEMNSSFGTVNCSSLTPQDETDLLERRLLILIQLKRYDRIIVECQKPSDRDNLDVVRTMNKNEKSSIAFKACLAASCHMNRFDDVKSIIKVWEANCPNDLIMMEARTKIEGLMRAVQNGIDPTSAFKNIDQILGLNDNLLLGKDDTSCKYKYRDLPPGLNTFNLCLQNRFGGHCSLGEKCSEAHSKEELEEWKIRLAILNEKRVYEQSQELGTNYIRVLLDRIACEGERSVLSSDSPEVQIRCESPLEAQVPLKKGEIHVWTFEIESGIELKTVALLYDYHRQYFAFGAAFYHGLANKVNLKMGSGDLDQVLDVSSLTPMAITGPKRAHFIYTLEVVFTQEVFGSFRQTLVFDFGPSKKICRKLSAEVTPLPLTAPINQITTDLGGLKIKPKSPLGNALKGRSTWNIGNAEILDFETGERVSSERIGFALINGHKENGGVPRNAEALTRENYREKMRFFLTQEERSRQEKLSQFNVSAHMSLLDKYEITISTSNDLQYRYAPKGYLFARMNLFRDVSEDTAVGRLILRSCNNILLTKSEEANRAYEANRKPRVFLAPIMDKTKNAMYINMGPAAIQSLCISNGEVAAFDVQFQLDRNAFIEMKKVIDRIDQTHLDMLFPDFSKRVDIPWSPLKQWDLDMVDDPANKIRLNPKQKEAIIAITCTEVKKIPPILIVGPFGTGKTFTLAQCIRKILLQPGSRIIVCTHSNSAADLYIKEYLDSWVLDGNEAATPLRIYFAHRAIATVHPTVLKYCLYENGQFITPTREEILSHRIIVVTLSTSYMLMDLELPPNTFSHILLDECAQAMETEAITPLMLAGENTRLVLAGDHMQLSPELFSEESKNYYSSLLERLHCAYPASHPCKLMLCENYRSHSEIIKFVSDSFYSKKLECGLEQPVHSKFHPLTFFTARGEDVRDGDSTSFYNMAETYEISERVAELAKNWPKEWGNFKSENSVGVLTPYSDQVSRIRHQLRLRGLYNVSVERVFNVQGKQFRAVFLSTVRKHKQWYDILPETVGAEVDLGFFSNPKLLNTALTRAQSLVAVVGDPVSLCSMGKCRRLWEDFLKICDEKGSLHGITYANLKKSMLGVEFTNAYGFNPLANEFEPKWKQSVVPQALPVASQAPMQVQPKPQPPPQMAQTSSAPTMVKKGGYFPAPGPTPPSMAPPPPYRASYVNIPGQQQPQMVIQHPPMQYAPPPPQMMQFYPMGAIPFVTPFMPGAPQRPLYAPQQVQQQPTHVQQQPTYAQQQQQQQPPLNRGSFLGNPLHQQIYAENQLTQNQYIAHFRAQQQLERQRAEEAYAASAKGAPLFRSMQSQPQMQPQPPQYLQPRPPPPMHDSKLFPPLPGPSKALHPQPGPVQIPPLQAIPPAMNNGGAEGRPLPSASTWEDKILISKALDNYMKNQASAAEVEKLQKIMENMGGHGGGQQGQGQQQTPTYMLDIYRNPFSGTSGSQLTQVHPIPNGDGTKGQQRGVAQNVGVPRGAVQPQASTPEHLPFANTNNMSDSQLTRIKHVWSSELNNHPPPNNNNLNPPFVPPLPHSSPNGVEPHAFQQPLTSRNQLSPLTVCYNQQRELVRRLVRQKSNDDVSRVNSYAQAVKLKAAAAAAATDAPMTGGGGAGEGAMGDPLQLYLQQQQQKALASHHPPQQQNGPSSSAVNNSHFGKGPTSQQQLKPLMSQPILFPDAETIRNICVKNTPKYSKGNTNKGGGGVVNGKKNDSRNTTPKKSKKK